jgi:hypothetical protein
MMMSGIAGERRDSSSRRQSREWIECGYTQRLEVLEITGQDGQLMPVRRRGDDDVGKSRRLALPPRAIGQSAGNPRCRRIESQDAVTIKMQDRFDPRGDLRASARWPLPCAAWQFRLRFPRSSRSTGTTTPNAHPSIRQAPAAQVGRPTPPKQRWCRRDTRLRNRWFATPTRYALADPPPSPAPPSAGVRTTGHWKAVPSPHSSTPRLAVRHDA